MDVASSDSRYVGMIAALAERHAQPLWDRYHRITTREPRALDAPMAWAWADMEPLVERAAREVAMEDAERRVLLLTHPAFGGRVATTTNLSGGLQTLLPGETARAHRHSLQAIRFVMSGSGAVTTVNRHRCPMHEGDLVLTPAWAWHEHIHQGSQRMVWFDGLDLPLLHHLDSMFFEIPTPGSEPLTPPPTAAALAQRDAVVLGPDPDPDPDPDGDAGTVEPLPVFLGPGDGCDRRRVRAGRRQPLVALRRRALRRAGAAHAGLLSTGLWCRTTDAGFSKHQQRHLCRRTWAGHQPGRISHDRLEAPRRIYVAALELDQPHCTIR